MRTWYRRDNGWFGKALHSRRAQIRVPGLEVDVYVEDAGEDKAELRAGVDAAYGVKYGHHGGRSVGGMVTDDAAATTLRLIPDRSSDAEYLIRGYHSCASSGRSKFREHGTRDVDANKEPSFASLRGAQSKTRSGLIRVAACRDRRSHDARERQDLSRQNPLRTNKG